MSSSDMVHLEKQFASATSESAAAEAAASLGVGCLQLPPTSRHVLRLNSASELWRRMITSTGDRHWEHAQLFFNSFFSLVERNALSREGVCAKYQDELAAAKFIENLGGWLQVRPNGLDFGLHEVLLYKDFTNFFITAFDGSQNDLLAKELLKALTANRNHAKSLLSTLLRIAGLANTCSHGILLDSLVGYTLLFSSRCAADASLLMYMAAASPTASFEAVCEPELWPKLFAVVLHSPDLALQLSLAELLCRLIATCPPDAARYLQGEWPGLLEALRKAPPSQNDAMTYLRGLFQPWNSKRLDILPYLKCQLQISIISEDGEKEEPLVEGLLNGSMDLNQHAASFTAEGLDAETADTQTLEAWAEQVQRTVVELPFWGCTTDWVGHTLEFEILTAASREISRQWVGLCFVDENHENANLRFKARMIFGDPRCCASVKQYLETQARFTGPLHQTLIKCATPPRPKKLSDGSPLDETLDPPAAPRKRPSQLQPPSDDITPNPASQKRVSFADENRPPPLTICQPNRLKFPIFKPRLVVEDQVKDGPPQVPPPESIQAQAEDPERFCLRRSLAKICSSNERQQPAEFINVNLNPLSLKDVQPLSEAGSKMPATAAGTSRLKRQPASAPALESSANRTNAVCKVSRKTKPAAGSKVSDNFLSKAKALTSRSPRRLRPRSKAKRINVEDDSSVDIGADGEPSCADEAINELPNEESKPSRTDKQESRRSSGVDWMQCNPVGRQASKLVDTAAHVNAHQSPICSEEELTTGKGWHTRRRTSISSLKTVDTRPDFELLTSSSSNSSTEIDLKEYLNASTPRVEKKFKPRAVTIKPEESTGANRESDSGGGFLSSESFLEEFQVSQEDVGQGSQESQESPTKFDDYTNGLFFEDLDRVVSEPLPYREARGALEGERNIEAEISQTMERLRSLVEEAKQSYERKVLLKKEDTRTKAIKKYQKMQERQRSRYKEITQKHDSVLRDLESNVKAARKHDSAELSRFYGAWKKELEAVDGTGVPAVVACVGKLDKFSKSEKNDLNSIKEELEEKLEGLKSSYQAKRSKSTESSKLAEIIANLELLR